MKIVVVKNPTKDQKKEIKKLQKLTFTEVDNQEVEEDFYHQPSVQVLAYINDKLVGWAGVYETKQEYEGRKVFIGGYGICTHPSYQRRGIASQVSMKAMDYLKKQGIDVAFLSVDPTNEASIKLHKKNGFAMLSKKFSWTDSNGVIKEDNGGMVASVGSKKLFDYVIKGEESFYVGNGYW